MVRVHEVRVPPRGAVAVRFGDLSQVAGDTDNSPYRIGRICPVSRSPPALAPSAYTSAMFSETRYALNGDLRVAYRTSHEGPRDIVVVPGWFTNCEVAPELPFLQGWVEAMTSLGRLIFFDQPGTGASDPVTPGALPTLEQWADSITAVLDDLGSREAVLLAVGGAVAPAALFAATHPSRTTALVVL